MSVLGIELFSSEIVLVPLKSESVSGGFTSFPMYSDFRRFSRSAYGRKIYGAYISTAYGYNSWSQNFSSKPSKFAAWRFI